MLILRQGVWGMPSQEILKDKCSEIKSEAILESKYMYVICINFKALTTCEIGIIFKYHKFGVTKVWQNCIAMNLAA